MSLLETMRSYGFQTPTDAIVLKPVGIMQRRQRRRQQCQVESAKPIHHHYL